MIKNTILLNMGFSNDFLNGINYTLLLDNTSIFLHYKLHLHRYWMIKIFYLFPIFLTLMSPLFCIPKAVVFDFGGVMTKQKDRNAIFESIGKKIEAGSRPIQSAKKKPSTIRNESFTNVLKEVIGLDPEMYTLVEELKNQGIIIALFSNIESSSAKIAQEAGFYLPFDLCFLSYQMGVEKPDLKAYEILLQSLNLPPSDILFIDDLQENVESAKRLGIDALLFHSVEELRKELSDRGILFRK